MISRFLPSRKGGAVKIAILSDIHSNLAALESVVLHSYERECEVYLCIGDIVGYYTKPTEVVALLSNLPNLISIMGNHDMSVVGGVYEKKFSPEFLEGLTESFIKSNNFDALSAIGWTIKHINPQIADFLIQDPSRLVEIEGVRFYLVHGVPAQITGNTQSELADYLYEKKAKELEESIVNFMEQEGLDVLLTGHTHHYHNLTFQKGNKQYHVVNPGSVGQCREGIPNASYCIAEVEGGRLIEIERFLLGYDIHRTREGIRRAELPETLGKRLYEGY